MNGPAQPSMRITLFKHGGITRRMLTVEVEYGKNTNNRYAIDAGSFEQAMEAIGAWLRETLRDAEAKTGERK